MKRRIFDSLVKQIDDQIYTYENVSRQSPLYRKMARFNKKGQQAHNNQQWLIKIIKRRAQILRENLEGYYIFRVVQQSLLALDKITNLLQDIIYQHQVHNGKIISVPKYRIVDPITTTAELLTTIPSSTFVETTTTPDTSPSIKEQGVTTSFAKTTEVMTTTVSTTTQTDIDWEKVNELDEKEVEKNTGLPILILSHIMDTLIAIGSTIVYGSGS